MGYSVEAKELKEEHDEAVKHRRESSQHPNVAAESSSMQMNPNLLPDIDRRYSLKTTV